MKTQRPSDDDLTLDQFALYVCAQCARKSNLVLETWQSYGPCQICGKKGVCYSGNSPQANSQPRYPINTRLDGDDMGSSIALTILGYLAAVLGVGLAIGIGVTLFILKK